jgi:hypothetical protein
MAKFGPIDYPKLSRVDHWTRAIRRFVPGFRYEFIRGPSGSVASARIYGDPLGETNGTSSQPVSRHATFHDFYRTFRHLSLYYQVKNPWERPVGPPPRWLTPAGQCFWMDVALHPYTYVDRRRWVEHFGPSFSLRVTRANGLRETKSTTMQLVWVSVVPGSARNGSLEIEMESFHYMPVPDESEDALLHRNAKSWNHSMYHYIEDQRMRPSDARQKLAGVDRELQQVLMKAFFGTGGAQGIVKVGGQAADVAELVKMAVEMWLWHRDYTRDGNEALRQWYRSFMANFRASG